MRWFLFLILLVPAYAAEPRWGLRGWYAIANPGLGDPFSLNAYLTNPAAHHGNPLTEESVTQLQVEYGSLDGNTDRWVRMLYDWVSEAEWLQYKDIFIQLYKRQQIVRPRQEMTLPPLPSPQDILTQIIAQREDITSATIELRNAMPLQLQALPPLATGTAHRLRGDKFMGYAVYIIHDTTKYGVLAELIGGVFTQTNNQTIYPWVYTPLINLPSSPTLQEFKSMLELQQYKP